MSHIRWYFKVTIVTKVVVVTLKMQLLITYYLELMQHITIIYYFEKKECIIYYVTLSHLWSQESTGIHGLCIPGLFPIPRVHLKVDQRAQRNNFPRIPVHLNVNWYTSKRIPEKLFLWTFWSGFWSENWALSQRLCIFIVKHKTFDCRI